MSTLNQDIITRSAGILKDQSANLALRFRALFTLKNLPLDQESLSSMSHVLLNDTSDLLKHEVAYCLGQMQDQAANKVLKQVLANKNQDAMVRHEAGEALAAIGSQDSLEILKEYSNDPVIEVAQTCQLGVEKILSEGEKTSNRSSQPFNSIDPAPPTVNIEDAVTLGGILRDKSRNLFDRYQAMFALRNLNSPESVEQLGKSLLYYQEDEKSALLKHEIAYIFGQMQQESSLHFLKAILEDTTQHYMVRHEAAEAIGSIGTEEAKMVLQQFAKDPVVVVKESVDVALDINDYQMDKEQFNFLSAQWVVCA